MWGHMVGATERGPELSFTLLIFFLFLKDLSVTAQFLYRRRSNNNASSIIQNQAPIGTKYTVIGLIPHGQIYQHQ